MSKMHAIPLNPIPIGFSPEKILGGATHNLNTVAWLYLKPEVLGLLFSHHGEIIIICKIEH